MVKQERFIAFICGISLAFVGSASAQRTVNDVQDYLGPRFHGTEQNAPSLNLSSPGPSAADSLRHWNQIAIDASGLDHTPLAPGETRVFGEQLGPARASRAMAIVHIAMFDSVNGIAGGFRSYTNVRPARTGASITTTIAQAARDTLTALFPSQQSTFDQFLASDLNQVRDGRAKTDGIDMGHRAAVAILSLRSNDGSQLPEPRLGVQFFPSDQPGKWRQDPISQSPIALGAYWGTVRPFVMRSARQFRTPTPPSLTSASRRASSEALAVVPIWSAICIAI